MEQEANTLASRIATALHQFFGHGNKKNDAFLATEDEYITFINDIAKDQHVKKEDALSFFINNHDELRMQFVFQAKKGITEPECFSSI